MSLLRLVLEASSSLIAFNACDLSMMRFIRAISNEMCFRGIGEYDFLPLT